MEKAMLNKIGDYFDLQSEKRTLATQGQSKGTIYAPVLPQYAAVCLGVMVEPYLRHYINSGAWEYDGKTLLAGSFLG